MVRMDCVVIASRRLAHAVGELDHQPLLAIPCLAAEIFIVGAVACTEPILPFAIAAGVIKLPHCPVHLIIELAETGRTGDLIHLTLELVAARQRSLTA